MAKINKRKKKQLQKQAVVDNNSSGKKQELFRRIILFGWMGLLLILPYLQAKTFSVYSAPKFFVSLIAIILLSAIAAIGLFRNQLSWPRTPFGKPIIFYSIVFLAATLFSVDRHISFFGAYPDFGTGLIPYILCLFFFYIILISQPSIGEIKQFIKLFVISGIVIVLHAIFERYGLFNIGRSDAYFNGRAIGILGNSDYTFSYLLFILPLIVYIASEEKKQILRGLYHSAVPVTFLSLFLLSPQSLQSIILKIFQSLPGLILIIIILSITIVLYFKGQLFQKFILHVGYKKICLAILGLLCLIIPMTYQPLSKPINTFLSGPANEQRFWAWKAGVEIGKEHILLGTGPATISYFLPAFQKIYPTKTWDNNTTTSSLHNEAVDHFATMGILGLMGYILLWGSFFLAAKKAIDQNVPEKKLITAVCASMILFVGFNQFLFSTIGTMLLPWLSAAVVYTLSCKTLYTLTKKRNLALIAISISLSVLIASFLIFWGVRYWIADYYYGKASKTDEESYIYSEKSVKIFPFIDVYWKHYGYVSYSDPLVDKLKKYNLTLSKEDQTTVLLNSAEALQKSVELRPRQTSNWIFYGVVLLRLKEFDSKYETQAFGAFSKSLELDANNNPYIYLRIADTYELMGDFEKAETYLDKAKLIYTEKSKFDLTIAYAEMYLAKGDKEKALLEYENALKYTSGPTLDDLKIYIAKFKRIK